MPSIQMLTLTQRVTESLESWLVIVRIDVSIINDQDRFSGHGAKLIRGESRSSLDGGEVKAGIRFETLCHGKWLLAMVPPMVGIAGFLARLV